MIRLSKEQIMMLHDHLIKATGGSPGVREEELLDSALASPFMSFGGSDLYPTILEKAARLGYGIIMNHPFVDGNKRSGVHAMLVFLALNNVELEYTQAELIDVVLEIAKGNLDVPEIVAWLKEHQR